MKRFTLEDHADSFLPEDKEWRLVWHDEFDGTELDRTKWNFRLNFWGKPFPAYTDEGIVLDGKSHIQLHVVKKNGEYCSPHLQTGSLTYDIPKDFDSFWPFGTKPVSKFLHRFGYYEIRCRLPKYDGWHSAFWLQAPGIGSHPNPKYAGVEVDIMENYRQYNDGKIIAGNIWGGYAHDCRCTGHFAWDHKETEDGWHYYGVDWSPDGYRFYADRKLVGTALPPGNEHLKTAEVESEEKKGYLKEGGVAISAISEVEQFILVSTECHGYREGAHDPLLDDIVLPDYFEVDHVRVFDAVPPAGK